MNVERGGIAHRYIALIILLITVYMVSVLFVALMSQKSEAKQRYANAQLQLQKHQMMAASLAQVQADNLAAVAKMERDDRYIIAASSSLAAAELQKKLQQSIQQSGARLISMQAISTGAEGDFLPISMKLHLRVSHQALMKLLYQLENQKPTGFIYDLHIQRQAGIGRRNQTLGDTLLDIRFEYTVFMVSNNDG